MAISYLRLKNNSALVFCLSSDTKPSAVNGYLLHETDTGNTFYVSESTWQMVSGSGYDGNPAVITQDSTHRFVTDTEKTTWDSKANGLGSDDNYVTDAEKVKLSNLSGTNTGDQDLSGKQDTLVSATNIKTINGVSVLGSGDLTVLGSGLSQQQIEGII